MLARLCLALALAATASSAGAAVLTERRVVQREYTTPDFDWAALSPDGATYARSTGETIYFAPADALRATKVVSGVAHEAHLQLGFGGPFGLRWSSPDTVWALATRDPRAMEPGVRPIRVKTSGEITPVSWTVPDNLHGLVYLDEAGLAIAAFDTRSYGPDAAAPTLAVLDAATGEVKARLDLTAPMVSSDGRRETPKKPMFLDMAAVKSPDGNVRLVTNFDGYTMHPGFLIWDTRGGPARVIRSPLAGALSRVALTADGAKILSAQKLTYRSPCPADAPCSIPDKPTDGVSLGLIDFDSGKLLWSRVEKGVYWLRPARPVISPDGRFAIVSLPSQTVAGGERDGDQIRDGGWLGVISMRDGRLLEKVRTPSDSLILQLAPERNELFVQASDKSVFFTVDWAEAARLEAAVAP